ncbi:hypothetical protein [Gloeothece verrucosa]|uniref:Uncharacterized protein n=1 Tax=Gloeothece verrucosa (strain PCC 7822) TaxID=497965 RepID=E0UNC9_GLOV7|nr:hypothetical protein [Gloeothece verrucosa]ADN18459.1 hypothetical protein Cyan7822_6805 [Gloeothece verrucosa PCC 7822]
MKINLDTDREIIQEAFQVLSKHLDASKVMRFLAICNLDRDDYLQLKEQLFEGETVDSLYEKIQALEKEENF